MKIVKVRNVKTPHRGTPGSAGLDFFVPEFDQKFKDDFKAKNPTVDIRFDIDINSECIELKPHTRVLIPSGVHVKFPKSYALIAFNKSGVSVKTGLDHGAEVVDDDYQGEIHLSLVNTSLENVLIKPNDKIIQFILIPVLIEDVFELTSLDELYPAKSERGTGGFGSTNK